MATDDPRCPYCVQGNEFYLMHHMSAGYLICEQCGHSMLRIDASYRCQCINCVRLRFQREEPRKSA